MRRAVIQTVPVRETFSLPRYNNKLLSSVTIQVGLKEWLTAKDAKLR